MRHRGIVCAVAEIGDGLLILIGVGEVVGQEQHLVESRRSLAVGDPLSYGGQIRQGQIEPGDKSLGAVVAGPPGNSAALGVHQNVDGVVYAHFESLTQCYPFPLFDIERKVNDPFQSGSDRRYAIRFPSGLLTILSVRPDEFQQDRFVLTGRECFGFVECGRTGSRHTKRHEPQAQ